MEYSCVVCGKASRSYHPHAKYCGRVCRGEAWRNNKVVTKRHTEIAPGTIGAIGELEACAHLMRAGYNVFRAMSPACPFDLYACNAAESLRVEVTTGHKYKRNQGSELACIFPSQKYRRLLNKEFDVLLIVFDGEVDEIRDEEGMRRFRAKSGWGLEKATGNNQFLK